MPVSPSFSWIATWCDGGVMINRTPGLRAREFAAARQIDARVGARAMKTWSSLVPATSSGA
jgi:hypothetical protein